MPADHAKYLQALGIQSWQRRTTPSAQIVFISDNFEFSENQANSADTLFTAMLNAIQLKRTDICLMHLSQNLENQINEMKPRIIIAMGNAATQFLLQTQEPLEASRSKLHTYGGIPLIITYPPAHLLRIPADKRKSYQDLLFLKQQLDLKEST